ncbi:MAG: hypothetical protein ABFC54_10250 [Thermoguttaceae bacterium]
MTIREVEEGTERIDDAIQFRQKGGGYWYPDTTTDRNALRLLNVTLRPSKSADDVLTQLSGRCFCQFNTPPLGRNTEAAALLDRCRDAAGARPELVELLDNLTVFPDAETLDRAAEILLA